MWFSSAIVVFAICATIHGAPVDEGDGAPVASPEYDPVLGLKVAPLPADDAPAPELAVPENALEHNPEDDDAHEHLDADHEHDEAADESEEEQQSILQKALQIIEARFNTCIQEIIEKVYGPTDEPISKELLMKPIKQEVFKETVYPTLLQRFLGGKVNYQAGKEFYKEFYKQLASDDMTEDYEIPPMPENYATETFEVTEAEREAVLNHPQSIYSIQFAFRKAFVIAKRHALKNAKNTVMGAVHQKLGQIWQVKEDLEGAVEQNKQKFLDAKEQAKKKISDAREDWNSENPSEGIKGIKDSYAKASDVYHQAKDALYSYWYGKPSEPEAAVPK